MEVVGDSVVSDGVGTIMETLDKDVVVTPVLTVAVVKVVRMTVLDVVDVVVKFDAVDVLDAGVAPEFEYTLSELIDQYASANAEGLFWT